MTTSTNGNDSQRLTKAQRAALGAWLSCKSQAEVARHIGTTKETVTRWLRQPHFADAVRDLERSAIEEARQVVIASQVRAVEVLLEQMDDDDGRIRQSAAVHLLKLSGLYNERITQNVKQGGQMEFHYTNDWRDGGPIQIEPVDYRIATAALAAGSNGHMPALGEGEGPGDGEALEIPAIAANGCGLR